MQSACYGWLGDDLKDAFCDLYVPIRTVKKLM